MFQTDINIYLQSFANEPLTFAMKAITAIGYEEFFFLFLIAITSGINFRKGFLLMQILMVTGIINQFFKESFALPRPWFVDSTLNTFGKNAATTFTSMGAESFWRPLPQIVVDKYRQLKPDTFGLPSGHTSTAMVLWASVAILFRKKWIQLTCAALIILIPLSRLYLARHFLADVLAGYGLGLLMLAIFYLLIYRKENLAEYLSQTKFELGIHKSHIIKYAYFFILPIIAAFFVSEQAIEITGFLFGLNLSYVIISYKTYQSDTGTTRQKFIRVLLTLMIFALIGFIATIAIRSFFDDDLPIALFARGFIIIFAGIYTSNKLNTKLGFIQR